MKELEKGIKWYKETFGEDFYIEVQRNTGKGVDEQIPMFMEQEQRNAVLVERAKAFSVKIVATNNVRFIKPEDWRANFTQRCAAKEKTGMMMEEDRHFPCQFRNMKSRKEMYDIFADMPEAVENTMEIFDKVEFFDIKKTPAIPSVKIPESFASTETDKEARQQEYLDFLTHAKAKAIYGELLPEEVVETVVVSDVEEMPVVQPGAF